MDREKLNKFIADRNEAVSIGDALEKLVLGHARRYGLTHEDPSDTFEREFNALKEAVRKQSLQAWHGPHADDIRHDLGMHPTVVKKLLGPVFGRTKKKDKQRDR